MCGVALDALHASGIYTLELQGTVVKQYYPQRHLRMMSDIDIIIPFEKLDEAERILQSLGYTTKNPNGIEVDARKGIIAVELHTEFFDNESATRVALKSPYSLAVCHGDHTATVSDTTFYLFHLLHTIKHCGQKGSGLRRIIDLYYLEDAMKDRADQAYIDAVLQKHGFYETKRQLLAIKDHWFRGVEPEEDLTELEADILESGNHGIPDKEKLYRNYPFCKKHRLPTVLSWILRWFSLLFSRRKQKGVMEILTNIRNA